MNPHAEERKQAPVTLIKQWKERGGTGEGQGRDRGGETTSEQSSCT